MCRCTALHASRPAPCVSQCSMMMAVDCGSSKLNLQISWTVTQQTNH